MQPNYKYEIKIILKIKAIYKFYNPPKPQWENIIVCPSARET